VKSARGASAAFALLSVAVACAPVKGAPLSGAPINRCFDVKPCEAYAVSGVDATLECNEGRCDFGRPKYPLGFTIVVNVPTSSFYAPGRTFVLTSADVSAQSGVTPLGTCIPPTCVRLPELVAVEGKYKVKSAAATAVGLPLPDDTSLPVRVSFFPLVEGTQNEAVPLGIPADAVLMASRMVRKGKEQPLEATYIDAVSVGRYLRVAYPEPPYDAYFPPAFTQIPVSDALSDNFVLGDPTQLDDETGDSRLATLSRDAGLDGWRVWLIDSITQRRISSIHALAGKKMSVTLHTVGWSQPNSKALKEDIDVVVAPPDGWVAVPRLQSRLINGQGLEQLVIPPLPGPASIKGVVAHGDGDSLTGIPAKVLFTSTRLRLLDGTLQPLLRYATSVATDDTGKFATVLPPGLYDVTIEPAEGTGFAKSKDSFDTSAALAKTYLPPPRTVAKGRVVLADGRALAEADILAIPSDRPAPATAVKPRPARTRTDEDGNFRFEVDQGQYDFSVEPQAGTGFAPLVQVRTFGGETADIGELTIAPPARLSFRLQDPSQNGNPIVRAIVRVFAEPRVGAVGAGGVGTVGGRVSPPAVEIGRTMSDDQGQCEILLAPQPP
jgi:hypothetical protein